MMVSGMGLCMQLKRLGLSDFNNSVAGIAPSKDLDPKIFNKISAETVLAV